VLLTRAILPAVRDKAEVPVASGVGKSAPIAPPDDSLTRKYFPGAIRHGPGEHNAVTDQEVPADEACCTDQPARFDRR